MCGIAGVMMKDGKAVDEPVLERLRSALGHRGPDSTGHYVRRAIGLVSTRLSIVDVGGGDQPLLGPDGTAVVCNGEIYNAPELRREFPDYPFHTWSDCGPVVPLVERDGTDFARSLRGMYGLAVYRPAAGTLLLARDPFGIKPLYYADMGHCFAFASELQALLRAGLACAAVEPASRNEFFQLKYTTGRRTVVPGVQRVAPGETLVLRDGEIVGRRQLPIIPSDDVAGRATPRDRRRRPIWAERPRALRRFERVMLDAVEVHLRMDTSWRLFLSGGVDSSILLALAQRVLDRRPVRALTVGYGDAEDGMDESAEAMRIAGRAGADCARVEMSPEDFWTLAPRIAAAIDDPTADPAVLPTYVLGRAASAAGAKVALTGEGADEIFGGYSRYRKATLPRLFRRRGPRRGVFTNAGIGTERFGAWEAGIEAAERRELARLHTRAQVLQAVDVKERLPNSLLIKLDRCLMAHGVEGRTPFLDKEVVRFAAGLPDGLKATLRFGKVLLREWLAGADPDARPFARKRGFEVPVGRWMHARRAVLADLVGRQPGVAEAFSASEVARVFEAARREAQPAWSLLFYALWHSHHILGVAPQGDVAAVLGAAADTPRVAVPA